MAESEGLAVQRIGLAEDALAGQTAVVTGAGRGIGREIARAFAWLGASVVIAEISDEGEETWEMIREAGGRALFVKTDVSDPDDVAWLASSTRQAFGPAHILVNNAILCPVASVLETEIELWDRVIAVNLRGTFLTCKAFLPEMVERGSGTIVNMVSTDAMPNASAYIASKQGIAAFSQSLAGEAGPAGVRVIPFAPGFVDTPGLRSAAHGLASQFGVSEEEFLKLSLHPAYPQGAMPADHAAAAAAYLVAELADTYHGEVVSGYTVLERAGFIDSGSAGAAAGSGKPGSRWTGEQQAALSQAIQRSAGLLRMIEETEAEFNKLPVFIRPMARAGFKSKSGQGLQEWAYAAQSLTGQLERIQAGDPDADQALRSAYGRWKDLLNRLAAYYQEVPAETARFTRDPEVIAEVTQTAEERVNCIRTLLAALDFLV